MKHLPCYFCIVMMLLFTGVSYSSEQIPAPHAKDMSAEHQYQNAKYYRTEGSRDKNKEIYWLREASKNGHKNAEADLGCVLFMDHKYNEAANILFKSAIGGYSTAQMFLSSCYERGLGVGENISEAYMWALFSFYNGNTFAKDKILRIELKMDARHFREAIAHFGILKDKGEGVGPDFKLPEKFPLEIIPIQMNP